LPLPVDLSCDVEVVKNFVVDFFEALGFWAILFFHGK
jgi:hypothetical protein